MTPKVVLICDLQFGSTGKGLIAGYLATHTTQPDTVMAAWAPNAGHTFINSSGRKFIHRMVPNGVVSPKLQKVLIGPGSVIDLDILNNELDSVSDILKERGAIVAVHAHAAYVRGNHVVAEMKKLNIIGSTQKGTAEANVEKMMRQPETANIMANGPRDFPDHPLWSKVIIVNPREYAALVDASVVIQLEGAQGFSLGIQSGIYPYVTSRECTPAQMLSDCAVPLNYLHQVVGTLRTFPIRVANRYDANGNMVGTSGPGYPDQRELSWDEIGVEPELTTVTKLPRRIFTFSDEQLVQALRACNPDFLFLNFCNYLSVEQRLSMMHRIERLAHRPIIKWTGHGATETDIRVHYVQSNYDTMSVEEMNKPHNSAIIR